MTPQQHSSGQWRSWTLQVKVWKLLAMLAILAVLVMWFMVVHQKDEILALVRNEVTAAVDQRTWTGSFVNTNDRTLTDVAVTVDFLDNQNRTVGKADAEAAALPFGTRLDLKAPLPADAVRLRIHSVQWRMGRTTALMGPFREPWEFGYLMTDPAGIQR